MFELVLRAPQALVEAVSDALMDELQALSVSVEDADADSDAEQALFGEPGMPAPQGGWQRSTLKALFAEEAQATEAATLLLAQDWTHGLQVQPEDGGAGLQVQAEDAGAGLQVQALRSVPDEDWVRITQAQFAPVAITPDFWIVPSWHEPPAQAGKLIRLDPGLAFGTGTHPTTRMCLRWIASHAAAQSKGWDRVLDYGCGSGILAIGAGLFGARHIDAVDIDPAAVTATGDNARTNGVALHAGLPAAAQGRYPLVLANILATPLTLLAPLLCGHVAPGGNLVLAGILARQDGMLQDAYAPWCRLEVTDEDEGWILMTARLWP